MCRFWQETDSGDGYNNQDGLYVVPVTGVYVFTYTVYVDQHNQIHAELVINGQVKNSLFADYDSSGNEDNSATAISVLQVNAADHVSVRNSGIHSTCNVLSTFDLGLTSFSGWRLF